MADYYDLGGYSRWITTGSPEAQTWFDRGLVWTFAFNHDEAVRCFEKALEADPGCAMAHWGIAYAVGPNYNKPWEAFDAEELATALARAHGEAKAAVEASGGCTKVEKALIAALPARYPQAAPIDDPTVWNDDYAHAMRGVYRAHRTDKDVASLFAEALINRTPWALWNLETGAVAEGADTAEAQRVLETALDTLPGAWEHPGLLHMHIHLMEMSPRPEQALRTGDALADLVPDAGHLLHMPTHVDVLCGHYQTVVERNDRAAVADRRFVEREGALNFYTLYRCHNLHFKIYGAMFLGQYATAIETAEELTDAIPEDLLRVRSPPMADWLEGFAPMRLHVLIRFGKWREILEQRLPEDPELHCVTTAMMRYARAVAMAATGDVEGAEAERTAFRAALAAVPETRMLFNNTCRDILAVAEEMMTGEIEYRKGNFESAFKHLRKAVELDDTLPYDEPWAWMQPTRHPLGALLLEQGRVEEAEAVYRADLGLDDTLRRACQHPDNVWSLHGLHECLTRRGETAEAAMIRQRLDIAAARADVPIRASCFCRMGEAA